MKSVARGSLAGIFVLAVCAPALGQEPKSAPLARQLADALNAGKLDSVAAKDPGNPNVFIGVLRIGTVQLLAISAEYTAPILLDARLAKQEYRDVYIELNSAGTQGSKLFVEDMGIDGLRARREDNAPADSYEAGGKRVTFDGDWGRQKLSEEEYLKTFATADDRYSQMLMTLLAQLKKTS
jgi:hypothetical protein